MFWDSVSNIKYEHPYLKNFFPYLMLPSVAPYLKTQNQEERWDFWLPAHYMVLLRSLHTGATLWFARFSSWLKKVFIAHKAIYRSGS